MVAVAVVLAGGSGTRMGNSVPKQFLSLGGQSVLAHTLEALAGYAGLDRLVLVSPPEWLAESRDIAGRHAADKLLAVVPGGTTRQESSRLGLAALAGLPDDAAVLVHDAVRPFVTADILERSLAAVAECGACDVAVPAVDTIIQTDGEFVTAIPDRKAMYHGQTPQGFRLDILRRAHELAREQKYADATDDVRLALRAGFPVRLVLGSYENIKITHPGDLELAEQILARRREDRK